MKSLEIVNKLLEKINQYDDWFLTEMEAEQIKRDLEVLEILKKYIPKNWSGYQIVCSGKASSMEDWYKVKQWLEENDNDR